MTPQIIQTEMCVLGLKTIQAADWMRFQTSGTATSWSSVSDRIVHSGADSNTAHRLAK